MPNAIFYSNVAQQTTLSGSISAGATAANVLATTGFPGSFPYILALDFGAATEELVAVTAAAGTTLTVTRGYGGTSAQSHSLGAVVRHVYNAQDATDFRTHEASTGAVHGLTGSIVGTSDAQSLSNKTLTSPTINAGALSGTFTGSPTLSGNVTFSGTLTGAGAMAGTWSGTPTFSGDVTHSGQILLNNLLRGTRGLTTDSQYESRVTGDANARWFVRADGKQLWGPGTAVADTDLFRLSPGVLGSTSTFNTSPTNTALDAYQANLPAGTAGDLLNLRVNNAIQAAMGSDGAFRIYGGNTPSTYAPIVGNGGSVTWSTRTGIYWKMGKIVFINIYLVVANAGSGTGVVTVDMPSNVDHTLRTVLTMHTETIGSGGNATSHIGGGECVFFAGGSGATSDRLRNDEGGSTARENNVQGADLLAGGSITIQGWYREA